MEEGQWSDSNVIKKRNVKDICIFHGIRGEFFQCIIA